MIFKLIEKVTSSEFIEKVTLRLIIYAILTNLCLEIFFWIYSGFSFQKIMFTSGLWPSLFGFTFFVGIFIGFTRAFRIFLTIAGLYMALFTILIFQFYFWVFGGKQSIIEILPF